MKTCINLTTLLILLTSAPGCSKFKELTRRDYALIRDPFAAKDATADSEPPVDATASTSGFVKIDDTAAAKEVSTKADYSTVAQSKPAQASNAAGFQGIRVRGMGDAISSEIGSAAQTAESAANTVASTAKGIPESAENAVARMEEAAKTKTAAVDVAQSKPPVDSDFAAWASSEVERWNSIQPIAQEKATPLLKSIQQVSKTVEHAATTTDKTASQFAANSQATERPSAKTETAASAPPVTKRELLKLKPKTSTASMPPPPVGVGNPFADLNVKPASNTAQTTKTESPAPDFDDFKTDESNAAATVQKKSPPPVPSGTNPFAAFDNPAIKAATPTPEKTKTLDSGFNFDSGWRPSDAVDP